MEPSDFKSGNESISYVNHFTRVGELNAARIAAESAAAGKKPPGKTTKTPSKKPAALRGAASSSMSPALTRGAFARRGISAEPLEEETTPPRNPQTLEGSPVEKYQRDRAMTIAAVSPISPTVAGSLGVRADRLLTDAPEVGRDGMTAEQSENIITEMIAASSEVIGEVVSEVGETAGAAVSELEGITEEEFNASVDREMELQEKLDGLDALERDMIKFHTEKTVEARQLKQDIARFEKSIPVAQGREKSQLTKNLKETQKLLAATESLLKSTRSQIDTWPADRREQEHSFKGKIDYERALRTPSGTSKRADIIMQANRNVRARAVALPGV